MSRGGWPRKKAAFKVIANDDNYALAA